MVGFCEHSDELLETVMCISDYRLGQIGNWIY
jgi:hypothetical protein